MKRFLLACALFCAVGAHAFWEPFWIDAEASGAFFAGDLGRVVDNGLAGALSLHYPFAPRVEGYLQGGYARVGVRNAVYEAANQLDGRAGLEWQPPWPIDLSVGAGVSILFVRGVKKPEASESEAMEYLLYDNESEFGAHARLTYLLFTIPVKGETLRVGVRAHFSLFCPLPKETHLMHRGVFWGG
jgi:hypothetical protein